MPLTPADVHNVVFKKPPIGKRGYDEDEVEDIQTIAMVLAETVASGELLGPDDYAELLEDDAH